MRINNRAVMPSPEVSPQRSASPAVAPAVAPTDAADPVAAATTAATVPAVGPASGQSAQTTLPAQPSRRPVESAAPGGPGQDEPARGRQLQDALKALNETVRVFDRRLQFQTHEETGRIFVRVIDTETGQVIREVPPEKILDMLGKMWQMIGLLIDERA